MVAINPAGNSTVHPEILSTLGFLALLAIGVGAVGIYAIKNVKSNLDGVFVEQLAPIEEIGNIRVLSRTNALTLDTALLAGTSCS